MTDMNEFNQQVIEEFRTSGGRLGGEMTGWPLLLLHHTGAKSGIERVTPLVFQQLGEDTVAVFASKAGAPEHPDWYRNLVAHPDATIELGVDSYPVTARVASGDERTRIFDAQTAAAPTFAEYAQKAAPREIPVVVLERTR